MYSVNIMYIMTTQWINMYLFIYLPQKVVFSSVGESLGEHGADVC